ncbi:MAG: Rieske 2Fe-2S domain-containing protein [Deltaproteobacteria bacterium]|nr:MAG: Rieske 2Fe-2S domain-containing protein [Deltaproteobacteria bacterium]
MKPTFIRVIGEDLVLFRDATGKPGVIGAYCAHRRANLCLGDIERDGVRCRYHGWLYDTSGKLVQIPGEPADSPLRKENIRLPAYPVEELGGLIFAYFGPQPVPLVPRYNFLVGEGDVYITIQGFQNCNWLQCVENGMDLYPWRRMAGYYEHRARAWLSRNRMGYGLQSLSENQRAGNAELSRASSPDAEH